MNIIFWMYDEARERKNCLNDSFLETRRSSEAKKEGYMT